MHQRFGLRKVPAESDLASQSVRCLSHDGAQNLSQIQGGGVNESAVKGSHNRTWNKELQALGWNFGENVFTSGLGLQTRTTTRPGLNKPNSVHPWKNIPLLKERESYMLDKSVRSRSTLLLMTFSVQWCWTQHRCASHRGSAAAAQLLLGSR